MNIHHYTELSSRSAKQFYEFPSASSAKQLFCIIATQRMSHSTNTPHLLPLTYKNLLLCLIKENLRESKFHKFFITCKVTGMNKHLSKLSNIILVTNFTLQPRSI